MGNKLKKNDKNVKLQKENQIFRELKLIRWQASTLEDVPQEQILATKRQHMNQVCPIVELGKNSNWRRTKKTAKNTPEIPACSCNRRVAATYKISR